MNGINRVFKRHVENNLLKYVIAVLVFATGVVLGVFSAMGCPAETAEAVTNDIQSVCTDMPSADLDTMKILKTSLVKNLRNFLIIFSGGFSVWLVPVPFAVLLTSGFSYGFTIGCMTVAFGADGFAMAFSSVIFNLLLTVPAYIILTVLAVNHSLKRSRGRAESGDFAGYVICFAALFVLIIPAMLADAFIVPEIIRQICTNMQF